MAETIPIDRISAESTQTRASLNDTVIDEYAEALQQGIELPPLETPLTTNLEPGPVALTSDAVTVGRRTLEPQATTISEDLLQQVTFGVRWDYATSGERQEFVTDYRDELQQILKKLDRHSAAAS